MLSLYRQVTVEAARRAVSLVGQARPLRPTLPMEIILELNRSDYCDAVASRPGIERLDARTIRKVAADGLSILP
jgi:D-aminopeptidase